MTKPSQPNFEQARIVASYPKTGRTWLRFMLASVLAQQAGLDIDIDFHNVYELIPNDQQGVIDGQPNFKYEGQIPLIEMTHQPYDPNLYGEARTLFLTRDPRDVVVSHWLHQKNQRDSFPGDLTEFVHGTDHGIDHFLRHLESWAPHLGAEKVIAYEYMRFYPVYALKKAVDQLDINTSDDQIKKAVSESSFAQMRQKEIASGIAGHNYDRANPEALRVRKGKVRGFGDYLNEIDRRYIERRIESATQASQQILALTGYKPLG